MYRQTCARALECSVALVSIASNGTDLTLSNKSHRTRRNGQQVTRRSRGTQKETTGRNGSTDMGLREQNYWATTVEMPSWGAPLPLPDSVDVAVVRAGFTVLSAAWMLARRGARGAGVVGVKNGLGERSQDSVLVVPVR